VRRPVTCPSHAHGRLEVSLQCGDRGLTQCEVRTEGVAPPQTFLKPAAEGQRPCRPLIGGWYTSAITSGDTATAARAGTNRSDALTRVGDQRGRAEDQGGVQPTEALA